MNAKSHINQILKDLGPALKKKYAAGVRAHGGGLWKKNIGPEIKDELLDLIVYVFTQEKQIEQLVTAAHTIQDENEHVVVECRHLSDLRAALAPFLTKPVKGND